MHIVRVLFEHSHIYKSHNVQSLMSQVCHKQLGTLKKTKVVAMSVYRTQHQGTVIVIGVPKSSWKADKK